MKKIILIALAAVMAVPASFAKKTTDPYHDKVVELLFSDGSVQETKEKIESVFSQKLESNELDSKTAKKLKKYMTGELLDDLISIYEEALRGGNVTTDELDFIIAYQKADSTKLINSKSNVLAERIQQGDSTALKAFKLLGENVQKMIAGEETTPFAIDADPEYEKAFHAYYTASGTNELMENYMENVFGSLFKLAGMGDDKTEEVQQKLAPVRKFFSEELEPAVMLMMDGIYSTDELNYCVRHMATPDYQHYIKAVSKADIGKLIGKILEVMGVKM